MNFLELQREIQLRARYKLDPEVMKFTINERVRQLIGNFRIPQFQEKRSLETTAALKIYALAEDVRIITDIRTQESDTVISAQLFDNNLRSRTVPFREIYDKAKITTNKTGHGLEFKDDPGTRTVALKNDLELHIFRHTKDMVENDDNPEFPLLFHDLIVLDVVVFVHQNKFGNSPLEGALDMRKQEFRGQMQDEPDEDFPEKDIVYDPRFVITSRPVFKRQFSA